MNDAGLNSLLKWSVEHSSNAQDDPTSQTQTANNPARGLNQEALAQLLGGPSDADRMKAAMAAIQSPEVDLDNKVVAFDNLEQLIENIDNANNMESLGLWMPLAEQLDSSETELQRMAAWCVGTAVQNNPRAQERCLVLGVIPKLANIAEDSARPVALRKKAIFALSSEVRNYQPALNELVKVLSSSRGNGHANTDAGDMEAVDSLINGLRESVR